MAKIFDSEDDESELPELSQPQREEEREAADREKTPVAEATASETAADEDILKLKTAALPPSPLPQAHTKQPHPLSLEAKPAILAPRRSPSPPVKEPPKKVMFKSRGGCDEERLVREVWAEPPDREDIVMLRLALGRLRAEKAELVGGVSWSHHPHDILSFPALLFHILILQYFLDSTHLPLELRPLPNGDGWTHMRCSHTQPAPLGLKATTRLMPEIR